MAKALLTATEAVAYNAAVDALNEAEDALLEALAARERAWNACNALTPLNAHGAGRVASGKRLAPLTAKKRPKRRPKPKAGWPPETL